MLVGQLIEILKQYDYDREVYIHTLNGETVLVQGYFIQGEDDKFYITDLRVEPTIYDKNEV